MLLDTKIKRYEEDGKTTTKKTCLKCGEEKGIRTLTNPDGFEFNDTTYEWAAFCTLCTPIMEQRKAELKERDRLKREEDIKAYDAAKRSMNRYDAVIQKLEKDRQAEVAQIEGTFKEKKRIVVEDMSLSAGTKQAHIIKLRTERADKLSEVTYKYKECKNQLKQDLAFKYSVSKDDTYLQVKFKGKAAVTVWSELGHADELAEIRAHRSHFEYLKLTASAAGLPVQDLKIEDIVYKEGGIKCGVCESIMDTHQPYSIYFKAGPKNTYEFSMESIGLKCPRCKLR